jgi:hypothetical protein
LARQTGRDEGGSPKFVNVARKIISFLLLVVNLHGALEFSGYLSVGKEYVFVVTDLETTKSSGWIATGDSFQGFKIVRFDVGDDALILSRDGSTIRLPLKASRIVSARGNSNKADLKLEVSLDGKLSLNGQSVAFDKLDFILQNYAKAGTAVAISVYRPDLEGADEKPVLDAMRKLAQKLHAVGTKNFTLDIFGPQQTK